MRRTMPQIILLNHGSWVNSERMKSRTAATSITEQEAEDDPIVWKGKRLTELTSEEMQAYYSDM